MAEIRRRTAQCAGLVAFGLLAITGCSEGGAWGVIDELGREDHSVGGAEDQPSQVKATVSRVVDGDTLAVETTGGLPANNAGGSEHSVRVLGVDAPEMDWNSGNHECGAEEAGGRLEDLIRSGDTVVLVYDEGADRLDRYSRSLAYVETSEGVDLGGTLIEEGLAAAWYPSSAPEPQRYEDYFDAQQRAESAGLGSWGQCASIGR